MLTQPWSTGIMCTLTPDTIVNAKKHHRSENSAIYEKENKNRVLAAREVFHSVFAEMGGGEILKKGFLIKSPPLEGSGIKVNYFL